MFVTRLISGIALLIIALATVILGGPVLFGVTLLISLIGMYELYRVFGIQKKTVGIVGYAAASAYYVILYTGKIEWIMPLLVFFFLLLMAFYVFSFPGLNSGDVMSAFFGLFYVAILISYLYQTRVAEDGTFLVWLIFISSWGCDTCAYLVGITIGKHKMTPKLSPKKSIEGAVGGILGSALIGFVFGMVCKAYLPAFSNPPVQCAIVCAFAALLSMVGDLAASAIKRNHDIKDYGTLIPGHGGIMDRFDSILFTAPVIFYMTQILQQLM